MPFLNFPLSIEQLNKLLSALCFILVFYLAYLFADLTARCFFSASHTFLSSVPIKSLQAPADFVKKTLNVEEIQNWNLFGVLGSGTEENVTSAQPTHLQLELTGVFRAATPEHSTAVIAELGGDGLLYHVGDTVPGDAVLEQILEGKVVLKRNGQREELLFQSSDESSGIPNNASEQGAAAEGSEAAPNQMSQLLDRAKEAPIEKKELLESFRKDVKKDPLATLTRAGLRAITLRQGGGYLVSAGTPSALIQTTGLQYGDVIRKVNGHLLGDVLADRVLYEKFLSQSSIEVEVERHGRKFTANVNLPN